MRSFEITNFSQSDLIPAVDVLREKGLDGVAQFLEVLATEEICDLIQWTGTSYRLGVTGHQQIDLRTGTFEMLGEFTTEIHYG